MNCTLFVLYDCTLFVLYMFSICDLLGASHLLTNANRALGLGWGGAGWAGLGWGAVWCCGVGWGGRRPAKAKRVEPRARFVGLPEILWPQLLVAGNAE